jgi:TolA-binding protein
LESSQTRNVLAGLHTGSVWFKMPEAPVAAAATGTVSVSPIQAAATTKENGPIHLQSDSQPVTDWVVTLSLLLWAGALIAIVILMLYLWRRSTSSQKKVETPAEAVRDEDMPAPPAATPSPAPTAEEIQAAFQRGMDLVRAGKTEDGIAELTKVIAAEPENNLAWFWLGIAAARQQDYRSAERCFLQARRHGHPEADKALEWLRRQGK